MKNIFEIMKEYGLEVPEDKKADFEKAVLENYKTVKDYEKQVEKLNETIENQKEDIAAAIKTLTEAEDSKMLFGEPDPKPDGNTNPIGNVGGGNHPKATESMADALREHYK